MEIRECRITEAAQHLDMPGLRAEYAAECAVAGLPAPAPDAATYAGIEAAGAAYMLCAFQGEVMIGFYLGLVHRNPHYGAVIGVGESFFVASAYRKTGAGLALLARAEKANESRGARGMFVSAPHEGPLSRVLSVRGGYKQSNDVFFKPLQPTGTLLTGSGKALTIPPTSMAGIERVKELDALIKSVEQVAIPTHHVIHAGVYSRTICVPKGVVLTAVLTKIPTTLVVSGHVSILVGDSEECEFKGYGVFGASAHRKQAYIAHEDTYLTMSFKTDARTVEEAEEAFTDEAHLLFSRQGENEVVITGD